MRITVILLLFVPCYLFSAAIHELGHVIAGIACGFKFHLFVIGPFGLKRSDKDRLTFHIEKNPALWGGASATLPQNDNDKNYKAFAKVLLAGPVFSLLFSAALIPIGLLMDNMFSILTGYMAFGMGCACLIPARNGCFYTDGGRWLRIHRKNHDGLVEMAIWNITQSYVINNNFSQIDLRETEVVKGDKDPRNQYLGYYYAYSYYKDINDSYNADKEKEEVKALLDKVPKNFLRLFPI